MYRTSTSTLCSFTFNLLPPPANSVQRKMQRSTCRKLYFIVLALLLFARSGSRSSALSVSCSVGRSQTRKLNTATEAPSASMMLQTAFQLRDAATASAVPSRRGSPAAPSRCVPSLRKRIASTCLCVSLNGRRAPVDQPWRQLRHQNRDPSATHVGNGR
jgi:hypothetical protein